MKFACCPCVLVCVCVFASSNSQKTDARLSGNVYLGEVCLKIVCVGLVTILKDLKDMAYIWINRCESHWCKIWMNLCHVALYIIHAHSVCTSVQNFGSSPFSCRLCLCQHQCCSQSCFYLFATSHQCCRQKHINTGYTGCGIRIRKQGKKMIAFVDVFITTRFYLWILVGLLSLMRLLSL